jgi:hypothetical protein
MKRSISGVICESSTNTTDPSLRPKSNGRLAHLDQILTNRFEFLDVMCSHHYLLYSGLHPPKANRCSNPEHTAWLLV